MGRWWPSFIGGRKADSYDTSQDMSIGEMANKIAPIIILIALVLGGIYGGYFTPTEAGAAGALGALVISLAKRRLTWASFWQVLVQTCLLYTSRCV